MLDRHRGPKLRLSVGQCPKLFIAHGLWIDTEESEEVFVEVVKNAIGIQKNMQVNPLLVHCGYNHFRVVEPESNSAVGRRANNNSTGNLGHSDLVPVGEFVLD